MGGLNVTQLIDALPTPILVVDAHGTILVANAAAAQGFGVPVTQLVGSPATSRLVAADDDHSAVRFNDLLTTTPVPHGLPFKIHPTSGPDRPCEVVVSPIADPRSSQAWAAMIHDSGEREWHERRVRESVKMEAVKTLAKHVANNFNNALAAVSGHLEEAVGQLPPEATAASNDIHAARLETRKAARIVRQLMNVAQPATSVRRPVDPGRVVQECVDTVRADLEPLVTLEISLNHGDWLVAADIQQLADVLISLAYNARDALPRGGHLHFHTTQSAHSGPPDQIPPELATREFVRIDVVDNGVGIGPEVLPRVFDPFFTTKSGDAAGLGLARVYEILRQHTGGITVESTPDGGTTFRIFLPRCVAPTKSPSIKPAPPSGGIKTILVIDDERAVRRVVRKALEHHGLRVLEAADGEEGLTIFNANAGQIKLVVLDVLMPQLSGWEVLEKLKAHPEAPAVILQSGFAQTNGPENGPENAKAEAFLRKPYELVELVDTVWRLLEGSEVRSPVP